MAGVRTARVRQRAQVEARRKMECRCEVSSEGKRSGAGPQVPGCLDDGHAARRAGVDDLFASTLFTPLHLLPAFRTLHRGSMPAGASGRRSIPLRRHGAARMARLQYATSTHSGGFYARPTFAPDPRAPAAPASGAFLTGMTSQVR